MICFKEMEIISKPSVRTFLFFFFYHLSYAHDKTFKGFEYWSDPNNRENGFINWQVDGQQTSSLWAAAVGPDSSTGEGGGGGSGVGQRLIPEEPMAIILNLGISCMFFPLFFF